MDGENNGKPYFLMDDLGGKTHYFWKHPPKLGFTTAPERWRRISQQRLSPTGAVGDSKEKNPCRTL